MLAPGRVASHEAETGSTRRRRLRRRDWLLFALIFLASSGLRLRGLNSPYITLWDESVQVNVVSNLIDACCTPKLHLSSDGANPDDWTDSYVWLHKPPLPLLFDAAVALPWKDRLFGIRFGALLAAQLIVLLVFWIGIRFFDPPTALTAAALIGFHRYTSELVRGTEFSGLPDLALACALVGAMYALLAIAETGRRRHFIAFGACSGIAFLCKDGLALIPFVVLGLLVLASRSRTNLVHLVAAALTTLVVVLPATLYLGAVFPAEALLEQKERVAHLLRDIEGWGRPADFYWTAYFPRVTSPLISGLGYFAVGCALAIYRRERSVVVLAAWVLAYLVVLSVGVSKIANFIYPIVPALYLLIPALLLRLWRERRYALILAGVSTVGLTAVVLQWNLADSARWLATRRDAELRAALVASQALSFLVVLTLARLITEPVRRILAPTAIVLAFGLVLFASVHATWAAATSHSRDYGEQMALRRAAMSLSGTLSRDDVVLVAWPTLRNSHLYVKFWSRLDSFQVTDAAPLDTLLQRIDARRPIYLLSREAQGGSTATGPMPGIRRLR
jgi:4-amino-4-deoxy-L-arabinose transferase-like glycosyltransferase